MKPIYVLGPLRRQFSQIREQLPPELRPAFDENVHFLDKDKVFKLSPQPSIVIVMTAFCSHGADERLRGENSKARIILIRGRGVSNVTRAVQHELLHPS